MNPCKGHIATVVNSKEGPDTLCGVIPLWPAFTFTLGSEAVDVGGDGGWGGGS